LCEGKAADPQFTPQLNAYQDLLRDWGQLVDDPWLRLGMGGKYYNVQDHPEGEIQMHGLDERDTGPKVQAIRLAAVTMAGPFHMCAQHQRG
tara:strand:+ start:1002 stop:1274 length:273 start_codon:yes stop_codon:yes gene_type:complete